MRKRKNIVQHAIEMAIEAEIDPKHVDDALIAMDERIAAYEEYSDFGEGTIGEIAGKLCREMDIDVDPEFWEDKPWAIAETAAAKALGDAAAAVGGSSPTLPMRDGHAAGAAVRLHPPANGHDPA